MGYINIENNTFSTVSKPTSPAMQVVSNGSTFYVNLTTSERPAALSTQKVFTLSTVDYSYLRPFVSSDSATAYSGVITSEETTGYSGVSNNSTSTTAYSGISNNSSVITAIGLSKSGYVNTSGSVSTTWGRTESMSMIQADSTSLTDKVGSLTKSATYHLNYRASYNSKTMSFGVNTNAAGVQCCAGMYYANGGGPGFAFWRSNTFSTSIGYANSGTYIGKWNGTVLSITISATGGMSFYPFIYISRTLTESTASLYSNWIEYINPGYSATVEQMTSISKTEANSVESMYSKTGYTRTAYYSTYFGSLTHTSSAVSSTTYKTESLVVDESISRTSLLFQSYTNSTGTTKETGSYKMDGDYWSTATTASQTYYSTASIYFSTESNYCELTKTTTNYTTSTEIGNMTDPVALTKTTTRYTSSTNEGYMSSITDLTVVESDTLTKTNSEGMSSITELKTLTWI